MARADVEAVVAKFGAESDQQVVSELRALIKSDPQNRAELGGVIITLPVERRREVMSKIPKPWQK
jgi:hypothetical protein